MTETQALDVLKKYTTKPNLIKHAKAVAATMRHFATLEGEDPEYWAVIGMLHDIDYECCPDQHCHACVQMLKDEGFDDEAIYSIRSHAFGLACDIEPKKYMEQVICVTDQLSGFIIACALMKPDKKLASVDVASVNKKWKDRKFAAGTERDRIIAMCETMGKPFDYMVEQTLAALATVADELGI